MLGFEYVAKLIERQVIEIAPLAYMRGRTLNNSFIILDESQNTTVEQMKMFLTRIGFGSTAVITGDITQRVTSPRSTCRVAPSPAWRMSSKCSRTCQGSASPTSSPRTWFAIHWCSVSSKPTSASRTAPSSRPTPRTARAMLELDLQLASDAPVPSEADLRTWCALALRQRSADSELTIRLVDEAEGRELNHTWRQKDYATNVLSFPADVPDELLDIPLLGDLVICVPVVAREAADTTLFRSLRPHR